MNDRLGIGVMLRMMAGNDRSVTAIQQSTKKEIKSISIQGDDRLVIGFADNTALTLFDDGQSCCECRYMKTDDDLEHYAGSILQDVCVREGGETEGKYGDVVESEFLIITTSKGAFTIVNYNEHNGYYGGFYIVATITETGDTP